MARGTARGLGVSVTKMTLEPMMIMECHGGGVVQSMNYFPDGKRMISGSDDSTTRQWDMQTGKEIQKARDDCGRGPVTQLERGLRKHSKATHNGSHASISAPTGHSTLFASGSEDYTTRIWRLNTGERVAGPFKSPDYVGAVRFSRDSRKLAVNSDVGKCLEVWNVQTQTLDKRVGESAGPIRTVGPLVPVFWTNKETILAVFSFITDDDAATIYEFDASTLRTVGAPFEGHNTIINGLALSFDGALVASASNDGTIKLWAFESRQLLASFKVQLGFRPLLILSPDSGQMAYTTGPNIHICNTPPKILTGLGCATKGHSNKAGRTPQDLLESDATRGARALPSNPTLPPVIPYAPSQPSPEGPQQHSFMRKFRQFSPLTDSGPPVLNEQPRDPLDFHAPSLPHSIHSPSQTTPQGNSRTNHHKKSRDTLALFTDIVSSATMPISFITHLLTGRPVYAVHPAPPIVDVPCAPGLLRVATTGAPTDDNELVPAEYFDIPSTSPDSQQPTVATPINSGEHGGGRLCFCL
ncbi:YVTN repeat-like/Quino protein amine dehydrogenase [Rhizopogon salebrosus TDB-379]|nr:YVTN repeat-like/Quino protein amine dehydrogenase [Rhizopogon salebrosus TDB-379]